MSKRDRDKELLLKKIAEKRAKLERQGDIKIRPIKLPDGIDPLNPALYQLPPQFRPSFNRKRRSTALERGIIKKFANLQLNMLPYTCMH